MQIFQKAVADTSKDNELDLLGNKDVESFGGTRRVRDLEGAADNLFTSPQRPQPLHFETLSLKTPAKTVPPTQARLYNKKFNLNLRNPWVLSLTSNCSNK